MILCPWVVSGQCERTSLELPWIPSASSKSLIQKDDKITVLCERNACSCQATLEAHTFQRSQSARPRRCVYRWSLLIRYSKASRKPNAQAAVCKTTDLEDCGEERISKFVDGGKEVVEQRHVKCFSPIWYGDLCWIDSAFDEAARGLVGLQYYE